MKRLHPVPCFIYFAGILVLSMTIFQPVFLASAVLLLFAVHASLDGGRSLKRYLGMFLFIILFMVVLNPLISHRGATILFYLFDNPVTMESIVYGDHKRAFPVFGDVRVCTAQPAAGQRPADVSFLPVRTKDHLCDPIKPAVCPSAPAQDRTAVRRSEISA